MSELTLFLLQKTRNEAKSSLDSLSICCMYALATSSLPSRGTRFPAVFIIIQVTNVCHKISLAKRAIHGAHNNKLELY